MRRLALAAVLALTGCTEAAWYDRTHLAEASPHEAQWNRIAWCESGSQWNHRPVHNHHGSFSGGLMIKSDVWDRYGGEQYASDAWQATRGEQIVIAEAILDDVGWRAWQCA